MSVTLPPTNRQTFRRYAVPEDRIRLPPNSSLRNDDALLTAAENGDISRCRRLLHTHHVDVNSVGLDGEDALSGRKRLGEAASAVSSASCGQKVARPRLADSVTFRTVPRDTLPAHAGTVASTTITMRSNGLSQVAPTSRPELVAQPRYFGYHDGAGGTADGT